ncbi:MAG TPA: [protein-PII] uridylyltransferase, partial [Gammaproteobacteria bacterium]|nr:[protein-PII] uridylyltransferase [Gammaproteobacteria bacterium]
RNHLLMSKTAQRKDISDPEVIKEFAETVGDRNHLNYLYLLTIADIQGTDPALWNNWKETLLDELYQKTLQAMRRGLENPVNKDVLIADTKNNALALIKNTRKLKLDLNLLWQSLGEDYFLRHTPEEIAWHSGAIAQHTDSDDPLIMIEQRSQRGGTQIFVYMKNRDNIFAATTRTLDRLGLNILDARIITSENNYTLDSYIVLEKNGEPVNNKSRAEEIIAALKRSLVNLDEFPRKLPASRSRRHRQFTIKTRVHFTADENNNRNIMEVVTTDRPGVLSRIGLALNFCGVSLQGAKIATYGARVEDIFFITDRNNSMIDDPIKFECLENSIMTSLESN